MTRQTILSSNKHQLFVSFIMCTVVHQKGFRLKDVEFFYNLINNWLYDNQLEQLANIQLVQISREIDKYVKEGFIKRTKENRIPKFRLNHYGITYFFQSLSYPKQLTTADHTLTVYYLLKTYGKFFHNFLVNRDRFQSTIEINKIKELLNPNTVILNQISILKKIVQNLDDRICENDEMLRYINYKRTEGCALSEIVDAIDHKFSYQMAYQKPFKAFLKEIPSDLLEFEVRTGFKNRRDLLFRNKKNQYQKLIDQYQSYLDSN